MAQPTWRRGVTKAYPPQQHDLSIVNSEQSGGAGNRWSRTVSGWSVYSGSTYKSTYTGNSFPIEFMGSALGALTLGTSRDTLTAMQWWWDGVSVVYVNIGGASPSTTTVWADGDMPFMDFFMIGSAWIFHEPNFIPDDNADFGGGALDRVKISILDARQRGKYVGWRFYMNDAYTPTWTRVAQTTTQGEVIPKGDRVVVAGGEDTYSFHSNIWNRGGYRRHLQRYWTRIQNKFLNVVIPNANGGDGTAKWGDYVAYIWPGVAAVRQGAEVSAFDGGGGGLVIASATLVGAGTIRITTADFHGLVTGQQIRVANATGMTAMNGTWTVTVVDGTRADLQGSNGTGQTYNANTAKMFLGSSGANDNQFNVTAWRTYYDVPHGGPYTGAAASDIDTVRQTDNGQAWLNGFNDIMSIIPRIPMCFAGGNMWSDGAAQSIGVLQSVYDPDSRLVVGTTNVSVTTITSGFHTDDYIDSAGKHYQTWARDETVTVPYVLAGIAARKRVWMQTQTYPTFSNDEFVYAGLYEVPKYNPVVWETGITFSGTATGRNQNFYRYVLRPVLLRQIALSSGVYGLDDTNYNESSTAGTLVFSPARSYGAGTTCIIAVYAQSTGGGLASVADDATAPANVWAVDHVYQAPDSLQSIMFARCKLVHQLQPTNVITLTFSGTVGPLRFVRMWDVFGIGTALDVSADGHGASGSAVAAGPTGATGAPNELAFAVAAKANSAAAWTGDGAWTPFQSPNPVAH